MNVLTSRQERILELIVLEYVKTVNPVGSKHICDELNCSSATVRSEMSTLEEYGFLEKTHTSSGRVPSEKGYRYYVDNLMKPKELNSDDMMNLQIIFNNNKLALNDCIRKSLEIISDITDYTTVVLGNKSSDNYLKKVEALPIEDSKMLTIVITDKGVVQHKILYLPKDVSTICPLSNVPSGIDICLTSAATITKSVNVVPSGAVPLITLTPSSLILELTLV